MLDIVSISVYIKVLNKGNKQMTKTFKNQLNKMKKV